MCVIIQKNRGVPLSSRLIANAFEANRDGAGFMWRDNAQVHIRKGFMRLHDLLDALVAEGFFDRATQQIEPDMELALHFRIATSGGVCPERTHPFPISRSYKVLEKVSQSVDVAIMHNGILTGYGHETDYSDTQEFVSTHLYHTLRDGMVKEEIEDIFAKVYGKFLIMGVDMLYRVGYWQEFEGLHCSNLSFTYSTPTTKHNHRNDRRRTEWTATAHTTGPGYNHASEFDKFYGELVVAPAERVVERDGTPFIHLVNVCYEQRNCIYCKHCSFHEPTNMVGCDIWRRAKTEAVQHRPDLADYYYNYQETE